MRRLVVSFAFVFVCSFPFFAQSTGKLAVSAISQIPTDSIQISIVDNIIYLENAPVGSKLEIFSILGVKVQELVIRMPKAEYGLNLPKGYYIVRVKDRVKKIIVR